MSKDYDVVVIGAGPAGSLAALNATRGGARTILLEKHSAVGRPICCAGGISVAGLKREIEPDAEWISTLIERITVVSPSGRSVTAYYPNAGYVLHRDKFDQGLARLAQDAGAELVTSAPAKSFEIDSVGNIKSVTVENGVSKVGIKGRIFIAADGVESRVAAMAGIDTSLSMDNVGSACQYLMDELDIDDDLIKIYLGNDIAPGGYAWLFPKSKDSAHIGLTVLPSKSNGKDAKWYLDRFISSNFPGKHHKEMMMGAVPAFHPRLPLARGNLAMVGDAARLLDSLSGAGISNAMISGSIAGRVAAQSLIDGSGLGRYPREFMKLKSKELYAYKLLKSIFVKATDSDFEKVVDALDAFFPDGRLNSSDIPNLALRLLLKNPSLLGLTRYMVTG